MDDLIFRSSVLMFPNLLITHYTGFALGNLEICTGFLFLVMGEKTLVLWSFIIGGDFGSCCKNRIDIIAVIIYGLPCYLIVNILLY